MGGDPREAGVYPMGLRLGEHQERTLRKWPLGRIKPKSVALGLRSFMAEVDALRRQLSDDSAVADAAIAHHKARADKAEAENARLRERVAVLEVLDEVYEWQRETFPLRTPASIAAHLLEEAGELAREPADAEEMADVAMLLFGLVRDTGTDLAAEVRAKLTRNRQRDWSAPPNAQGYVKARAALAGPEQGGAG